MIRLTPKPTTRACVFYFYVCVCSVVCLSSVFHHVGTEDWEAAAVGTLPRWAYPESKLAMVRLAKASEEKLVSARDAAVKGCYMYICF